MKGPAVTGRKDKHNKVYTAKGPRDRRLRLSAHTAIEFYDVQDRLGYDRPSKALDWLIVKAKKAIDKLNEPTSTTISINTHEDKDQHYGFVNTNTNTNQSSIPVSCVGFPHDLPNDNVMYGQAFQAKTMYENMLGFVTNSREMQRQAIFSHSSTTFSQRELTRSNLPIDGAWNAVPCTFSDYGTPIELGFGGPARGCEDELEIQQ